MRYGFLFFPYFYVFYEGFGNLTDTFYTQWKLSLYLHNYQEFNIVNVYGLKFVLEECEIEEKYLIYINKNLDCIIEKVIESDRG